MRKTPQCACIVLRSAAATSGTDSPVVAPSRRARRASGRSAASFGSGLCAFARQRLADDEIAGRAAEHQQVDQRIGAEPVGAVHRHARALADRVEAVDDRIGLAVLRRDDLAVYVGRDAAHLVVDRRHHRDRLLDAVDVGELERDFADRRQPLQDHVGPEVVELQHHVVLVRTAAAPFLDLLVHRPADDVARREVLQVRRVALHEALAVAVEQDAALAAHAFGDQHARAVDAGRVELPELHVLERECPRARPCRARRRC